jgi:predicted RNase H-like HicB family nuclease
MAVVFEATIKVDEDEQWFIELKDLVDGRVTLCNSIEELEEKI